MSNKINIIFVTIVFIALICVYNNCIDYTIFIPIIIIYIAIVAWGSSTINLNYFFFSHCNGSTKSKEIAITFDDGPHPDITPKLLHLLKKHNIVATFFCTGINVENNKSIISKIIKDEHIIGNHSYGHSIFFDLMTSLKMKDEIIKTNDIIYSITKLVPLLFRPPYGVTNPLLKKALKKTKMVSIGWSLRSLDTIHDTKKVVLKLKNQTKPGDIVLLHDTNPNIIEIMDEYINWLHDNNYKIVSLTELLKIQAYEN